MSGRVRTLALLLDLQGDGLSGLLQQEDGFTQWLPLQTAAVDGQDPVTHMDGSRPAGGAHTHNAMLQVMHNL